MSKQMIVHGGILSAHIEKLVLHFKLPAGTSRGVLKSKPSWILTLTDTEKPGISGRGEISVIEGLSPEWGPSFEEFLAEVVAGIQTFSENPGLLEDFPSVRFAVESAILDLKNGGNGRLFPSDFTNGKKEIGVNGLIWMGSPDFMMRQAEQKQKDGFHCLKFKIGAIDFEQELDILKKLRRTWSASDMMLRVDANGAFNMEEVFDRLDALAKLSIHSIEQPIKAGQLENMAKVCAQSPVPIALDEELIGIYGTSRKSSLIAEIKPQFLIFKPSLLGGFGATKEWIDAAEKNNVGWWITSALESNLGLSAIAQFTATVHRGQYHGLGTGQLFSNNLPSALKLAGDLMSFTG